jgi:VanZ family protein
MVQVYGVLTEMIERTKQDHFLWYKGPMILWAIALFTQSSIPGDRIADFEVFSHDKLIHFFIYVVFAATVNRAVANQGRLPLLARRHFLFTLIIVALFAGSDEFHQYFVPNRSCDFFDWLADCAGAILCIIVLWAKTKWKPPVAID